jgi:hypothetical protein
MSLAKVADLVYSRIFLMASKIVELLGIVIRNILPSQWASKGENF